MGREPRPGEQSTSSLFTALLADSARGDRGQEGTLYDEPRAYDALAQTHGVVAVTVVSVGEPNNSFLAGAAADYSWIRPLAALDPDQLTVGRLEALTAEFPTGALAGIALSSAGGGDGLAAVPAAAWQWLVARRWLISQNNRGEGWLDWQPVLRAHPELRLSDPLPPTPPTYV